jgi:hypothetical protein
LHDLPDLKIPGGNHPRGAGVQFGIAERFARRSQLRFRGFKRALCGSQLLLRVVVGDAGGEERVLPIKGRLRHAQLGLRCGYPCGGGFKIGLLLGRIELGEEIAGIDVGADIDQALEHAPAHTKGEVGAETGLDFASQREPSVAILRLNDFGAHERSAFDGGGGGVIAGSERRRQKRECERNTNVPQNCLRERMGDGMVHGGLL